MLAEQAIDIAILDYEMPEMNGCMLAGQIRARHRNIRIILHSGSPLIPENEFINIDAFVPKGRGAASLFSTISELTHP
jgi:CheY-like chemotaxis protein